MNSSNPNSGVSIAISPADRNGAGAGSTSLTRSYAQGTSVTLTAPATSGGNAFASWSGACAGTSTACTVTMNANATLTANYASPVTTPTVTVTPASTSITTAQALSVTVAVNGVSGTATGSVTLNSGNYTSGAIVLSSGSATIDIPAGSLAIGSDTLTATYTPDFASSSTYFSATGSNSVTVTFVGGYVLTVNSTNPASGVTIGITFPPTNMAAQRATSFTEAASAGETFILSAPATSGSNTFSSWTGCASVSTTTCTATLYSNTTVTANYSAPSAPSVVVTPSVATIGSQVQFLATVSGQGMTSQAVTWALTCPACGGLSAGTLSASGLYTTPYPAPASVTITATSTQNTAVSGTTVVTLSPPATASGPALSVDVANQTHPINPYIYGMNFYSLDSTAAKASNITVDRFGGDATSRYNYQLDVTNSASDWFFENQVGNNSQANSSFNEQVLGDQAIGAKTLGTVDVLGWVAKDGTSCSFPKSTYPSQYGFDPYRSQCGDGETASQAAIAGNDPSVTSQVEGPAFAGGWVAYLVSKFGTAANGGVASYDLDNEPAWWDAVHRDVHPVASTYDEVTNNGIATAKAIKIADPTATVQGPVVDFWWNYFYSKKDIENGWSSGPCWQPWSGPTDREAHGGVPFIEYYLQQFKAASATTGYRLLDYLDLHTYFAATYNGSGVGLSTAGDTGEQIARLNSTRVFWDPAYTDPNYPQPNYKTDSNYTSSCSVPLQAPQLIPMMQTWVANDYPGTKTAITEYNWGGQESINGAVAQADILGIFGSYGLDLATLWGPPDPVKQVPGLMAYEIYRNYDGNNSTFGDTSLASTSVNQGVLSVYGALRSSDGAVTVMVLNKTYGAVTSTLSLSGLSASATSAQPYLYSNANLNAIVPQTAVALTPPGVGSTIGTIANYSFPAQSITLFVIAK